MTFFHMWFIVTLIIIIGIIVFGILKLKNKKSLQGSSKSTTEVLNELKKSANPEIPNDIDGQDNILNSIGFNRVRKTG